ncbi:sigma-70 family RNA polymerase sigma factor [Sphingomonas sp. AP4-R1]|uniref:sigma-70 family RNA polymerase sigma factor n=1 Tax=Sphingomonas sp. AP4-R1 TaxID=2735134 RepID=UPI00149360F4|nr:sigma-70 family RNA polymerase sigma factor [Sphingomonas sp. AP4-R1]QJU60059.1 sigma-70 family RNA polymerase sigma factor [Sphingomonas sp. AP4-R1]
MPTAKTTMLLATASQKLLAPGAIRRQRRKNLAKRELFLIAGNKLAAADLISDVAPFTHYLRLPSALLLFPDFCAGARSRRCASLQDERSSNLGETTFLPRFGAPLLPWSHWLRSICLSRSDGLLVRAAMQSAFRRVGCGLAERAKRFEAIMLPHMGAAYSLARFLTRDAVAADDVVQEAFLNAYRGFDGWRGSASKAWLLAIVRNCVFARSRDPGFAVPVEEAELVADQDPTPEEWLIGRYEAAALQREIEELPPVFREVLVLRELEELSYKEIATIVDVPIGTIMSRLARARQMLGARLSVLSSVSGDRT